MSKPSEARLHLCECAICQAGSDHGIIQQYQRMNLFLSRLTEPSAAGMLGCSRNSPIVRVMSTWRASPAWLAKPFGVGGAK
jgi:hypothetical protein